MSCWCTETPSECQREKRPSWDSFWQIHWTNIQKYSIQAVTATTCNGTLKAKPWHIHCSVVYWDSMSSKFHVISGCWLNHSTSCFRSDWISDQYSNFYGVLPVSLPVWNMITISFSIFQIRVALSRRRRFFEVGKIYHSRFLGVRDHFWIFLDRDLPRDLPRDLIPDLMPTIPLVISTTHRGKKSAK